MDARNAAHDEEPILKSWLIVLSIALAFLVWGLFIYHNVGDKGPPAWDYSVIQDIPGESTYSSHSGRHFPTAAPDPAYVTKVPPQHVRGPQQVPGVQAPQGTP